MCCAALHGQSNVGSMCDCKPCRSLDVSVLVENPSAMVQAQKERQCQLKVNSMSIRKNVMLTKDAPLSSHLSGYVSLIGQFLLDLASLKTLLAWSIL